MLLVKVEQCIVLLALEDLPDVPHTRNGSQERARDVTNRGKVPSSPVQGGLRTLSAGDIPIEKANFALALRGMR